MSTNRRPEDGFWSDFAKVASLEFIWPYLPILLVAAFLIGAAVMATAILGIGFETALIAAAVCAGLVFAAWHTLI